MLEERPLLPRNEKLKHSFVADVVATVTIGNIPESFGFKLGPKLMGINIVPF